jgi:hypothetical protein
MAATLEMRLSGGTGNTDPNAALGGARSTAGGGIVPTSLTANSLFDDVTGAEEQAGDTEYRCVYIRNSGDVQAQNTVVWLSANTADADTTIDIGLGSGAVDATEQTVANESTAPTSVTFSAPSSEGAGLSIGSLNAGSHKALWLRRTVNATAGASNDTFTVASAFDTAP